MTVLAWRTVITEGDFGRFVLVNADYDGLAWSGSEWTPHRRGIPTGRAQVSNFDSWEQARDYAEQAGLSVVTYRLGTAVRSITCLRCQHTSFNPEDVEQRYCGHCHIFMDAE
jgi:hypothetical protein